MNEGYFENPETNIGRTTVPKGDGLATAALILGFIGALGIVFVFPPFIFGATAIALGLLSRGDDGLSMKARIGMFMGGLSMALLVVIVVSGVHLLMSNPDIRKEFNQDFDRIYEELENGHFPSDSFT